jgi:hypothetical protein
LGFECEGAVCSDSIVVALIVLQNEAGADQAGHVTADREARNAAYRNARHVGGGSAGPAGDGAEFVGAGGLSKNSDVVSAVDGRLEGERAVRGDSEAVAAVVLKNESGPGEAGDGDADGGVGGGRGASDGDGGDIVKDERCC